MKVSVDAIEEYISEYLFPPCDNWPNDEFRRRSYSRWAACEILERVRNDNRDPLDVIEEFSDEMDQYFELSDESQDYYIFIVARETADEIAYLFL